MKRKETARLIELESRAQVHLTVHAAISKERLVEILYETECDPPVYGLTRDQAKKLAAAVFQALSTAQVDTPWQDISTAPKHGTFLAAIKHGKQYMVVEAKRIGPGVHHVAEDSCVGWHPGCKDPAYWSPLPEAPSALKATT